MDARLPRAHSACRLFPEIAATSHRSARLAQAAIAIGLGLTLSCAAALAQSPAKGSPETSRPSPRRSMRIDQGKYRDFERLATIGLDYAETRFQAQPDQCRQRRETRAGVELSAGILPRRRGDAGRGRWHHVPDRIMEHGACHRRPDRKQLWTFDPKVDREKGYKGCCDVVNRGVAVWKGKVFVGAYDGRLFALDAATGKVVWERRPSIEQGPLLHHHRRAARVQRQGGDRQRRRGIRRARLCHRLRRRDRQSGMALVHRARRSEQAIEDETMAAAAKTWDPAGKYWHNGGGGTAWDTIVFDPDLNLVYIGTGNGAPWKRKVRSPTGGDNLFCLRSSRSMPRPESTTGTIRKRPAITGTTPLPSR